MRFVFGIFAVLLMFLGLVSIVIVPVWLFYYGHWIIGIISCFPSASIIPLLIVLNEAPSYTFKRS